MILYFLQQPPVAGHPDTRWSSPSSPAVTPSIISHHHYSACDALDSKTSIQII